MAKSWSAVAQSERFQNEPRDTQEAIRRDYFDSVVAPRVRADGRDVTEARAAFDSATALPPAPTVSAPPVAPIAIAADNTQSAPPAPLRALTPKQVNPRRAAVRAQALTKKIADGFSLPPQSLQELDPQNPYDMSLTQRDTSLVGTPKSLLRRAPQYVSGVGLDPADVTRTYVPAPGFGDVNYIDTLRGSSQALAGDVLAARGNDVVRYVDEVRNATPPDNRPDWEVAADNWLARTIGDPILAALEDAGQVLTDIGIPTGFEGRKKMESARARGSDLHPWSTGALTQDAVASAPLTLGALSVGAVNPVAGMGVMAEGAADQAFIDNLKLVQDGRLTMQEARDRSYGSGAAEAVYEFPVLKGIKTAFDLGRKATQGAVEHKFLNVLEAAGAIAVKEPGSEVATELTNILTEKMTTDKGMTVEQATDRVARAALLGVGMGAVAGGAASTAGAVSGAVEKAYNNTEAGQARQKKNAIDAILKTFVDDIESAQPQGVEAQVKAMLDPESDAQPAPTGEGLKMRRILGDPNRYQDIKENGYPEPAPQEPAPQHAPQKLLRPERNPINSIAKAFDQAERDQQDQAARQKEQDYTKALEQKQDQDVEAAIAQSIAQEPPAPSTAMADAFDAAVENALLDRTGRVQDTVTQAEREAAFTQAEKDAASQKEQQQESAQSQKLVQDIKERVPDTPQTAIQQAFSDVVSENDSVDNLGTPPDTDAQGNVVLTHYSGRGDLTEVSPEAHGSGLRGAEGKRKQANPDLYPDRSYFYANRTHIREPGLGNNAYEARVPTEQLYDMQADPDGLKQQAKDANGNLDITRYEAAIKAAGYRGYMVDTGGARGVVAALFTPTVVSKRAVSDSNMARKSGANTPSDVKDGGVDPILGLPEETQPEPWLHLNHMRVFAGAEAPTGILAGKHSEEENANINPEGHPQDDLVRDSLLNDAENPTTNFSRQDMRMINSAFAALEKLGFPIKNALWGIRGMLKFRGSGAGHVPLNPKYGNRSYLYVGRTLIAAMNEAKKDLKYGTLMSYGWTLAHALAHETGHSIDVGHRDPGQPSVFASTQSPAFAMGQSNNAAGVSITGDILVEMLTASGGDTLGMRDLLHYPFGELERFKTKKWGRFQTPERLIQFIQKEAFAQLFGMYYAEGRVPANAAKIKKLMPKAWALMEDIDGVLNRNFETIQQRDAAVRAAFRRATNGVHQSGDNAASDRSNSTVDEARPPSARDQGSALDGEPSEQPGSGLGGHVDPIRHPRIKTGDNAGQYIGAPPVANTAKTLPNLRRRVTKWALEAEAFKDWYKESSDKIMELVNGDKVEAEKVVQIIAITSPNNQVGGNLTMAVKAYMQYKRGETITVGKFADQAPTMNAILYRGEKWDGRKTNSFYVNLMTELDPTAADRLYITPDSKPYLAAEGETVPGDYTPMVGFPVTVDMWMMRAFSYPSDSPTNAQYHFVEREIRGIADKLGWTPHQVQAALWVALKARWVKIRGGQPETPAERNAALRNASRVRDMTHEDLLKAGKSYSDYLDMASSKVPFETVTNDYRPADVSDFNRKMLSAIQDNNGKNLLAEAVGAALTKDTTGTGGYAGTTTNNLITTIVFEGGIGEQDSTPAKLYALGIKYVYRQEEQGWFRLDHRLPVTGNRYTMVLTSNTPVGADGLQTLQKALTDAGLSDGLTQDGNHIVMVNFGEVTNRKFKSSIEEIASRLADELGLTDIHKTIAEGDYYDKTQSEKDIESEVVASGSPALLENLRGWREAADAIRARYRGSDRGRQRSSSAPLTDVAGDTDAIDAPGSPADVAREFTPDNSVPSSSLGTSAKKQKPIADAFLRATKRGEDSDYARQTFAAYQKAMPDLLAEHNIESYDDLVNRAYEALVADVEAQFAALPIEIEWDETGDKDYATSREMFADVENNNHMWVFKGGEPHEMMGSRDADGVSVNDKFRAIHDYFGHAVQHNQFGPKGEEQAWEIHSKMVSPLAQLALTTETRGQNSVVNYSALNQDLFSRQKTMTPEEKTASWSEFKFAEQKAIILPPDMTRADYTGETGETGVPTDVAGSIDNVEAPQEPVNFTPKDEDLKDRVARNFQDKFQRLYNTMNEVREHGGKITEDSDPYAAEERMHGKIEQDFKHLEHDFVEPLAYALAHSDVSQDDLGLYLIARHAEERNAHIATINDAMPDGGSGMTDQQAQAVRQQLEEQYGAAELERLSQYVYDILEVRKHVLTEHGLLSSETIDQWDDSYERYVPLKGFAEDAPDERSRTGKGLNIKGKEVRRALGRKSLPSNPVIQSIQDTTESIIRARKNEVGQHFLKLVQDNPSPKLWQIFTNGRPDKIQGVKPDGTVGLVSAQMQGNDDYFGVKVRGRQYYVKIKDPLLKRAMNNLGLEEQGTFVRVAAAMTRFLSTVNTSANPEFVLSNFSRDIQTAVANLFAEQDLHDSKTGGEKIVARVVKGTFPSMRPMYRALRGVVSGRTERDRMARDFLEDGAKTGFFDQKDMEAMDSHITNLVKMARGGAVGNSMKGARAILQWVDDVNGMVENAVRLSAYTEARKAMESSGMPSGRARKKAAHLAKNLTVNFNRRGERSTVANALWMFFNASAQGTAQFGRTMVTMKKMPDGSRKFHAAQKLAATMTALAFAWASLMRAAADDDDDGTNLYDDIPGHIKERNIVIMKPNGHDYWTIPLPYGYNIFHVLGTTLNDVMLGKEVTTGEGAMRLTRAVLGSFNPIGMSDSESVLGTLFKTATPTVLTPAVEITMNENFFGGPIYREDKFNPRTPESSLSMATTKEHYKVLSRWLNAVGGGNNWQKGWGGSDISPDKFEHWAEFILGGAGRFVDRTTSAATKASQGVPLRSSEIPFYRVFNKEQNVYRPERQYYDRRAKALSVMDRIGDAQSDADVDAALKGTDSLRAMASAVKATDIGLKQERERRDRIRNNSKMSAEMRDTKLRAIRQNMNDLYNDFNAEWDRLVEQGR